MVHKAILYGDHAVPQMERRGLTRADVKWLLAQGIRTPAPTRAGAAQRWEARGYIGHREAAVIFIETATTVIIVTVEWLDSEYKKEDKG